ncbi:MAG: putative molybdenum carrier protein [Candidatus Dojkabacteria bacterium]|nr:putative molybdenum carrier protein [Candidatus Dojkabacteria bacterium]
MKIITGGQSGADLAGNYFAKKHGIETEINAERNFHPLYDEIPNDIKINIVSDKEGNKGGWIERRRFNIKNSDFTLILIGKPIQFTRGSRGTYNDCIKLKKDCLAIDIFRCEGGTPDVTKEVGWYRPVHSINIAREIIKSKNIKVLNNAGERNLNKQDCIDFLEKLLL